jgi:hypothetical protein
MKMKKFYLTAFVAALCNMAMSQSFFVPTTYRGAFAPAPETPWTDQWTNWDPQNTNYGTSNVNVTTNITNNTTWTANNVYLLQGQIYVQNGAVLTIQPGTIVMGDKATTGSGLFVTQGSKLVAAGTASQPIVFTSNQPVNQRAPGDWGGIVLLGRSNSNYPSGIANIEGIAPTASTQFGGGTSPDVNDNSGKLEYVRIEFGGYVYQTDKEINGLTLGAVGKGTSIHHVQVSFANDDAFEWFGGTVDCSHLVSFRNLDDDFDTDNGFSGKVQFGLVVRDPNMADNPSISTSEGFESDNNAAGGVETPQTSAIFSNITLVGPLRGNSAATVASGFRRGARIRRNSALKIYNSIFMDFSRGLHIDGGACENNATNGSLKYKNNINAGYKPNFSVEKNSGSSFAIKSWYGLNNNDSISLSSGILVNPYGDNSGDFKTNLDFRPVTGSVALSNYAFNDSEIISFVINAPTTASATIEYCVGETATALTATAKSDCTLKWYNVATGGSSISTPTPSTVSAGTTTYYVSQANAAGTEGPRTLITVIVHANPTAPVINANGPTSLCTGSSVDLSSNQVSNNVWSTNATTQTITVNTSGTYSVVYTDANQCSATSNTITINVSNAPLPTVQVSGSLSLCQGDSVELTASTSDSYLWSNGETTQSIYVDTAATYYVTTTNANACNGVGQSANSVVTVAPQPTAVATFVITNGNTVAFTNTSTYATSYSWDFGDFSSSSAPSPTHVFLDFNDYTVVLTAINGGCQDTAVFNLTTLSVKEIANDNSTFVSIFPNPMSEMGMILVDVKEYSPISIVITDNKGAIVNEVLNQNLEVGKHSFSVDTNNFENGLYYVIVRTSKSNNITKINVIK